MEKTLWKNKWVEVYEKDGWYTCTRGHDGVCVLAYRYERGDVQSLVRLEHTPCHEDGPRVGKYNRTSITGMVEDGLTPIETAVKELLEETGYTAKPEDIEPLGWVYVSKQSSDKCYLFAVDLSDHDTPTGLLIGDGTKGEEGASVEWVPVLEVLELPSSSMSACIARLLEENSLFRYHYLGE